MKSYLLYRLIFFGIIALSVGMVFVTIASRQSGPVRASQGSRTARTTANLPPRPPETTRGQADLQPREGTTALSSRVRITTVIPFRREIEIHNFGDAAQDLSDWTMRSPRPGGDDVFTIPVGVVLLPGESLTVVVDEGVDAPGELHWRVAGDQRVLDLTSDSVFLEDDTGALVSRFTYVRS